MLELSIGNQLIEIDPIEAHTKFGELEKQAETNGTHPNAKLLDLVAGWLEGFGVESPTRTAAWSVWWLVYEAIEIIRKQTTRDAELAFWYGINPFELDGRQRVGLMANIDRVKAQKTLHDGRYRSTDYEFIYHATLLATGDQQAANAARSEALERYVDSKTKK